MREEKQIEEMAKSVCYLDRTCDECMTSFECKAMMYAKRFYDAGYRKASDVAREIGEEIQRMAEEYGGGVLFWKKMQKFATELKKKYTEERE